MIVQCPSCAARYRVNDANIPPSGGKIRCPSCSHAFVVYPEAQEDAAGAEERTSIAQRPNLKNLLNSMRSAQESDDDAGKTEVISSDSLPDFGQLVGQIPEGDKTVEMSNPLMDAEFRKAMLGHTAAAKQAAQEQDELMTQELTSDLVQASLNSIRDQAGLSPLEEEERTQIAPPLDLGQLPAMQQPPSYQQRISAPDGPTPPPPGQPQNNPPLPTGPGADGPATRFPTTGRTEPPAQSFEDPTRLTPLPDGLAGGRAPSAPGAHSTPPPASDPFGSTPLPGPAAQRGPDPNHQGPWHLQTPFGIVYNFQDMQGLRNHLEPKESLEGYQLSADGATFYPLSDFPQIQGVTRSGAHQKYSSGAQQVVPQPVAGPGAQPGFGPSPSVPMPDPGIPGPGPQVPGPGMPGPPGGRSPFTTANQPIGGPGSPQKVDPNAGYRPPTQAGKQRFLNGILWLLFGVLAIAALGLALHLAGVIDLFGEGDPTPAPTPQVVEEVETEESAQDFHEVALDPEELERIREEVDRMLEEAQREIDSNRLPRALEHLERARSLDPDRIQVYVLMAEAYETLEEHDEAEAMRSRARQLREGVPIPPDDAD
jgi:predicted Zn finger-like uncharacterized protein